MLSNWLAISTSVKKMNWDYNAQRTDKKQFSNPNPQASKVYQVVPSQTWQETILVSRAQHHGPVQRYQSAAPHLPMSHRPHLLPSLNVFSSGLRRNINKGSTCAIISSVTHLHLRLRVYTCRCIRIYMYVQRINLHGMIDGLFQANNNNNNLQ